MIHQSLELIGYSRFLLNRTQYFSIALDNPVQVILGTNGSGKSSLLLQLVQLVPPPTLFDKTGSKTHRLTHNGRSYLLKAVFHPAAKYYFEVDGEVLNDWGVAAIQKNLVEEHFGLTPMVQRMMLGEERFHAMSAPRRREWMIEMCATDHTYALSLFNKARERHRDIQGALKLQRQSLAAEMEKRLSDAQREALIESVSSLHEDVTHLIERRIPVDPRAIEQGQSAIQSLPYFSKRIERVIQQELSLHQCGNYSCEQLQAIIDRLRLEESSNRALLEQTHQELVKREEGAYDMKLADQYSAQQLSQDIAELTGKSERLLQRLNFPDLVYEQEEHYLQALSQLQGGFDSLIYHLQELPPNPDGKYSSVMRDDYRRKLINLKGHESAMTELLIKKRQMLKHHREHLANPKQTCPSCGHNLMLELTAEQATQLEATLTKTEEELTRLKEKSIREVEDYLERCAQYEQCWRSVVTCMRSMSALKPHWDALMTSSILREDPTQAVSWVERVRMDLQSRVTLSDYRAQIDEKAAIMIRLRGVGGEGFQRFKKELENFQAQYQHYTARQSLLGRRIDHYRSLLSSHQQLNRLKAQLDGEYAQLCRSRDDHMEQVRRESFNAVLQKAQSLLAAKEDALFKARQQQSVITHIEQTILTMEQEEQAADLLVKSLSPSEGLIARSLFGFIRQMTSRMNSVISSVWNYEMKILPCELSNSGEVELDYLFPVKVEGASKPLKDVKEGSKGMIEIMDLAFKIVALGYLGHSQSALILDELGSAMDQHHRVSFIRLIHDLSERGQFPQIFVVSHDYEQCSALATASVCVLCDRNIAAPSTANRHVTIE